MKNNSFRKVVLALFASAGMVALFAGCGSLPKTDAGAQSSGKTSRQRSARGSETIVLQGNPTTGYTWQYSIYPDQVASVEEDIKYNGAPGVMGASSTFTYTITALEPGEANLEFSYNRPWEEGSELQHKNYLIIVDSALQITVQELSFNM